MNDRNDFFNETVGSDNNERPVQLAADYFTARDAEDLEEKTPGHLREDASRWDQFTNGQRRLIVFGVLLAVILVLALIVGIGSSCGSCELCAGGSAVSDSDSSDRTHSEDEIVPEEPVDTVQPDVAVSQTDAETNDAEISDDTAPDDAVPGDDIAGSDTVTPDVPDTAEPQPDSGITEDKAVSETDTSDSDAVPVVVSPVDIPAGDDTSETPQAAEGGFFSSCHHEADNEAGSGTGSTNKGFLSFLFGCTGCAESCNISCTDSLTDPAEDEEEDPDRSVLDIISGTDAEVEIWPQQADDQAYIAMMGEQLTGIFDLVIQLNGMDSSLSQYTDPQRIKDNDQFREVAGDMLFWCQGAEEYDASALTDPQALECNRLSLQLADDLQGYLEDYPRLITGTTSGTDIVDKAEQINIIMADLVALYDAVNGNYTPEQEPVE